MIYYDSHKWRTLVRIRGSVLHKAMLWAIPSALIAFALKYGEQESYLNLERLTVLTQGDIYSGFTYVLGFSLVFRTSQSYLRYWTAATSVHEMSSEWSDSCASLIAFAGCSRASNREIERFRHTVVRLFSLLHAMALSEIASIGEDFPLLDIQGLTKSQLSVLTSERVQGRKVQIVLSWIKGYITRMADRGFLTVPAPILTRVFQELGAGLVNFHKSQQIVIWPFPFPYTQLNLLLIQVYTLVTPLVVCTWGTWPWMCFVFTFISVTCMVGLDMIASELENPFGDDANDLPVLEMQEDMNKFLTMQLNPAIHTAPELEREAVLSYTELAQRYDRKKHQGLLSRIMKTAKTRSDSFLPVGRSRTNSFLHRLSVSTGSSQKTTKADRWRVRKLWLGEETPSQELHRLQNWLRCLPAATSNAFHETLNAGSTRLSAVARSPKAPIMEETEECDFDECREEEEVQSSPSESEYTESYAGSHVLLPNLKTQSSHISCSDTSHAPEARRKGDNSPCSDWTLEDDGRSHKSFSRRQTVPLGPPHVDQPLPVLLKPEQPGLPQHEGCCGGGATASQDCGSFLCELKLHLSKQLEVQRNELLVIENMLLRWGHPHATRGSEGSHRSDGEPEFKTSETHEPEFQDPDVEFPDDWEPALTPPDFNWDAGKASVPAPLPRPLLMSGTARRPVSSEVKFCLQHCEPASMRQQSL